MKIPRNDVLALVSKCSLFAFFFFHSLVASPDTSHKLIQAKSSDGPTPSPTQTPTPSAEPIPSLIPTPPPTATPWPEIDLTPEQIPKESVEKEPDLTDWLDNALGSPDADCDGILNKDDNCALKFNPDQADKDRNGIGDVCDGDAGEKVDSRCDVDHDGILDRQDNCPLVCNPDQKDKNKNGIGDVCDPDLLDEWPRINPCQKPKINPRQKSLTKMSSKQKSGCGKSLHSKFN